MKRNKAFTLIELLGVLIILGVIAVIATPIVINYVNESREESKRKSVDFYVKELSNEVKTYMASHDGKVPDGKYKSKLDDDGKYLYDINDNKLDGIALDFNGDPIACDTIGIFSTGDVYVDKCYYKGNTYINKKDDNSKTYSSGKDLYICKPVTNETKTTGTVPSGNYNLGDEYICNVDNTNSYHFFILSVENDNVNLILDRNVCEDGKVATNSDCKTAWYALSNSSSYGPLTVFSYLQSISNTWNSIPNIEINYVDAIYGSIQTSGKTTVITKKDTTITGTYTNLKVRLPEFSELSEICSDVAGSCPLWAYNYMNLTAQPINGFFGYWLVNSHSNNSAWRLLSSGSIDYDYYDVNNSGSNGVRPVISIPKSNMY